MTMNYYITLISIQKFPNSNLRSIIEKKKKVPDRDSIPMTQNESQMIKNHYTAKPIRARRLVRDTEKLS